MTSLYDDERYSWRETYFVLFPPERRPRASQVRRQLEAQAGMYRILDWQVETDGSLRSLTIASYEDHSALEILYREGDDILAETGALAETLEKSSTPDEIRRLRKAKTYRAKFDILHFEQTAGTGAFKIVKMPDLSFSPRTEPSDISRRYRRQDSFPNTPSSDKLGGAPENDRGGGQNPGRKSRFHFDPDCYENCRNDGAGADLDEPNRLDDGIDGAEDSAILERFDPNTLVLVLEILCRLTDGVAIDPAGGVVI